MAKAAKKTVKKTVKKTAAKKVVKKVAKKAAKSSRSKSAAPAPASESQTEVLDQSPATSTKAAPAPLPPSPEPSNPKIPRVGAPAPKFHLPSSVGKIISLADYAKKTVVLYFYPRADTPGCTVQACAFRDAIASYGNLSVDVLGISPDSVKAVTDFAKKFNLNFPLLADAAHRISDSYGTWIEKSMYGKTYWGTARTTFIIKNGIVAYIFERVKPEGHEAEVLKVLESLQAA